MHIRTVRSVTVADPPRISIVETIVLARRPKKRKVRWGILERFQRQPMISRKV
jgi:hypothetical protein